MEDSTNMIVFFIFTIQIDVLRKRAYLAPFLVDIDIPPELLLVDDVSELHVQFDLLQDYFKTTHKHLESIRKKDKDPNFLKENVQALEVEKNHLCVKIQKLKKELQVLIITSYYVIYVYTLNFLLD